MYSTITKGSFILKANDPEAAIDVYLEILKTKNIKYENRHENFRDIVTIPEYVMEQILLYIRTNEYAQMPLYEFLDRLNVK